MTPYGKFGNQKMTSLEFWTLITKDLNMQFVNLKTYIRHLEKFSAAHTFYSYVKGGIAKFVLELSPKA
jgi:hypothetical protein